MAIQTNGKPTKVIGQSGVLAEFDDLVEQLRGMLDTLETRVSGLTNDMQIAAEISTRVANILDVDDLLPQIAEEMKTGFELHHVNIYLMDDRGKRLPLRASSGEEGRRLLHRNHSVDVRDERNIVAQCAQQQHTIIVNDTQNDDRFDFNDLIPGTLSRMAIPMLTQGRVLGVIDMLGNVIDRFDDSDVRVKTTLAEQLAVSIDSASAFSEVQRARTELSDSQDLLQAVLNNVPARVFSKDLNGIYQFCNNLFLQDAGLEAMDDIIGKSDYELPWAETEAEGFRADDMEVMESGVAKINFDEKQTNAEGQTRWLQTSKVPLYDNAGQVVGVLGLYSDITDRKRSEERVQLAYEIGQQLNAVQDPTELLQYTVDAVSRALGYYYAHIYLFDSQLNSLRVHAGLGRPGAMMVAERHNLPIDAQRSLVASAARSLKPVVVQDVYENRTHLPNPLIPRTRSEASIPLFIGNELLGVLDLQADAENAFPDDEVQLLVSIGNQLSIALSNARQLEATQDRLREVELLGEASRIIAEAYTQRDMLEGLLELLATEFGADNAAFTEYHAGVNMWQGTAGYGMDREFVATIRNPYADFPHGVNAIEANTVVAVDNAYEYEDFPMEYVDSIGIKSVVAMPVVGRNERIGVAFFNFNTEFHTFTDSEVRLLESVSRQVSTGIEAKRAQEANLRLALLSDNSTDFIGAADLQTQQITYVNQSGLDLLGYKWSELEGQTIHTLHTEAAFNKILEEGMPVVLRGETWTAQTELERRDGTVIPVEQQIYILKDAAGEPVGIGTAMRDIRERLAAEAQRERAAEQFRQLVDAAPEAIIVTDTESGQFVMASQSAANLYEVTVDELLQYNAADLAPEVQPDGRLSIEVVQETIQTAMLGEIAETEWYIQTGTGKLVPTEVRIVKMPGDAEGKERLRVSLTDISARKEAEYERSRVYDMSVDMIGAADLEGYLRELNPAWERVLGFTTEELTSRPYLEFVHPDDIEATLASAAGLAEKIPQINFINRYATKDGGWRWLSWNAAPDYDRELVYFVTRDITDERENQRLIQERARQLEIVSVVATQAANTLDLNEMLINVVNLTKKQFDLYHAHVYLLDGTVLRLAAGAGEPGRIMKEAGHRISLSDENSVVARAARNREGVVVNDVGSGRFLPNPMLPRTRSELAVPLVYDDEVIGVLDIQSGERDRFTDEDVIVQTTLAGQISVAVKNAAAFQNEQRERLLNEQVAQVTRDLSAATDETALLAALKPALDYYQPDLAALVYAQGYNEETGTPEFWEIQSARIAGEPVDVGMLPTQVLTEDTYPIVGATLAHPNEILFIEDAFTDPITSDEASQQWLEQAGGQTSLIVAPMRMGERWVGYIGLSWAQQQTFSDEFRELLNRINGVVTTSVETRRAFLREQAVSVENNRRAREMETVAQVSAATSRLTDTDEMLQQVADLTKAAFELYHAHIYLYDEPNALLVLAAGADAAGRMMKARNHAIPLGHPTSVVAHAARDVQNVNVADVTQSKFFLPNPLLPETRSEMALPMIVGNKLVGILDVQANVPGRFGDEDVRVKSTLAAQVGIAIENARAFQENEEILGQLAENEELLRQFVAYAPSAVAMFDTNMKYLVVSERWYADYNLNDENIIGQNHYDIFPDMPNDWREAYEAVLETGEVQQQDADRFDRADGTTNWLRWEARPWYNANGEVAGLIIASEEISEQLERQRERERLLEERAERLREVNELKSQFLASMSHELRTPLNSIIGYSEVLLDGGDGDLSEDAEEDIEIIHTSGRHLLAIINDILDLAKIEANQMKLHREEIDIVKILRDVVKTNQVLLGDKPIELKIESDFDELIVSVDELRIRQVMLNLFSNAVKFTEEGSVTLELRMLDNETAKIAVIDTGIGMDQDGMDIAFDQFRQVDGSSTRKQGGTGLGLTITRYLVQMHGGDIQVESEVGKGTTFWFTLPLSQPDEEMVTFS